MKEKYSKLKASNYKVRPFNKHQFMLMLLTALTVILLLIIIFSKQSANKQDSKQNIYFRYLDSIQNFTTKSLTHGSFFEDVETDLVTINIIFKGGAALDNVPGISNLLINSLIKSAGDMTVSEFNAFLDAHAIKLSTNIQRDHIELTLTTLAKYRNVAFEVLDLLFNNNQITAIDATLAKQEVIAQYNIISNKPSFIIQQRLRQELFPDNPFFKDSIYGNPNSINQLTLDQINSFKYKILTKSNIYVAVSGNMLLNNVKYYIENIVSKLPVGDEQLFNLHPQDQKIDKKVVAIKRPNIAQSEVFLVLPVVNLLNEQLLYYKLINSYLGAYPSSFLFNELRNKKGLVYTVSSSLNVNWLSNYMVIRLGTSNQQANFTADYTLQLLASLQLNDYQDDLELATNWLLASQLRNFSDTVAVASLMNYLQFYDYSINHVKTVYDKMNNVEFRKLDSVFEQLKDQPILSIKYINQ